MHQQQIFHSLKPNTKIKPNSKIQFTNLHYIIKHLLKHFVTQPNKLQSFINSPLHTDNRSPTHTENNKL